MGPNNPPCPACGEPLFGWLTTPWDADLLVLRCERCGLASVGQPEDAREIRRELARDRMGEERPLIGNRASLAAWIGAAAWAPLEPGVRSLLTPEALSRLDAPGVNRGRWAPGPGVVGMWQTLLNTFTFGRNLALARLGRATATPAAKPWQRRLDVVITFSTAGPLALVAVLLELAGGAAGKGGVLRLGGD